MLNNSKKFMSFGKMPIANNFLNKEDFVSEYFFDMDVSFNEEKSLFHLKNFPEPKQMFNENYKFFTSSSNYMTKHFENFAYKASNKFLKNGSKVIEIGCNDGTLLNFFRLKGFECLGFEPSSNVASLAEKKGLKIIKNFFSSEFCEENFRKKTDLICAANVICHIPDLDHLIKSLDTFLSDEGVFIFEEPYLGSMFEKISYDQIYDEHIYIFSISSINKLFEKYDFELFLAEPQFTHGGSMRYFIRRKSLNSGSYNIESLLESEKNKKLDSLEACIDFKKNCEISKERVLEKLNFFKKKGLKISGYAATSKSTTILNYCNIGTDMIDCIYDTTPEKIGKFSPGMHIPIEDYKNFKNNYPDVAYLFAWNHKEEITKKESVFLNKGGKWFSHVEL
tara:strand:- start:1071 stop:2249 length:1179 start_codon:yes stop_codon:yes gene_type:complete